MAAHEEGGGDRFPTTHVSAVLGVKSDDDGERTRSLEMVTAAYWKPVYKYVRMRWRLPPEEAEDVTQDFFARALDKSTFATYDPARGRFRTFVRTCLERFVIDRARVQLAKKRGGGAARTRLDFADAENELAGATPPTPDALDSWFESEFVRHIMALAVIELRKECERKGKTQHYRIFERYHLADAHEPPAYATVAEEFAISTVDVTNRLNWVRREFRRLVLETLRGITGNDDDFKSEARAVFGVEG
jgi:DNA-directed RNA polymerase specialized sigma24 family protein